MTADKNIDTQQEQKNFSADVSRLLEIVAHALYTNHDVFLRELISNAADACDRLRYDSIQNPDLISDNPNFRICTYKDTTARTLSVVDNGIGMSKDELAENLGTIAKSGTAALMKQMEKAPEGADKLKLIGQFGVGFYAGYMVAHKIEVVSRKAGSDEIWCWESDGKSGFTITQANDIQKARLDGQRGTAIMLHIKDEACDFLLDEKITRTVKEYSDHVNVPIYLGAPSMVAQDKDANPINEASALWMLPKSEISEEQYTAFYHNIAGGFDEPSMISHWRAEGKIEFSGLLFTPTMRPWDLYDPTRRHFVKLYVRRVFITDELENLVYPWLRFLRGVIDSEDLPLNISRESLQYNPIIEKIKNAIARKVLGDLDKLSRDDAPAFATLWGQFGPTIKEGLYDAVEHREALLKICRFYTTHDENDTRCSLEDYKDRMIEGQEKIYYISGENLENIKNSPQLEGFKSRGIEVLLLTDTIDDFWLQNVLDYKDVPFQSITKGDVDFSKFKKTENEDKEKNIETADEKTEATTDLDPLIDKLNAILKNHVHNVRRSSRLTESPVCLIAPDNAVDMHMERVLKVHQKYDSQTKPVLEINPSHALIKKLGEIASKNGDITDAGLMLLDQAKIIQGQPIDNPTKFAQRLSNYMSKAI